MSPASAEPYTLIVNVYRGAYREGSYDSKYRARLAMVACVNPSVVSFTIRGPFGDTLYTAEGKIMGAIPHLEGTLGH